MLGDELVEPGALRIRPQDHRLERCDEATDRGSGILRVSLAGDFARLHRRGEGAVEQIEAHVDRPQCDLTPRKTGTAKVDRLLARLVVRRSLLGAPRGPPPVRWTRRR